MNQILWHHGAGPGLHISALGSDAAEGPSHLSIHSATATACHRHIYPDISWVQQTTGEAVTSNSDFRSVRSQPLSNMLRPK